MNKHLFLSFLSLSILASCSVHQTQEYQPTVPENFEQTSNLSASNPLNLHNQIWWQLFADQQLSDLIEEALTNSPDMLIATERVIQAELALRSAGASRYPNLDLSASTGHTRNFTDSLSSDSTRIGASASYEIDLWKKNSKNIANREALLKATEFDQQAAKLSLAANVAQTYFELSNLRKKLELANKNLEIAQRLLDLVEVKQKNGVATALDVSRQLTSVLNQKSSILPIENSLRQTEYALAILLGKQPQNFKVETADLRDLEIVEVGAGLPADLLKRRPDLAASEQKLISSDLAIYAAKADRWPSISLTANGGIASSSLLALTSTTTTGGLSLGIAQSIFDAGRKKNQVLTTESQYRVAIQEHNKLLLNALVEVENALADIQSLKQQEVSQEATLKEAQRSLELAEFRYQEGKDDLITVLDVQRTLFQTEESALELRKKRLNSAVNLYKVLGGSY